jgi:hypothetical protein
MKRGLIVGGILLVIVIVAIGVYLYNSIDSIVESAIEQNGSAILGTDVHVGSVDISLKSGRGTIRDIAVDNPKGFGSGTAFRLSEITLDIQVASLAKDPIVIEQIAIKAPEAHVVMNAKAQSNIGVIKSNVDTFQGPHDTKTSSKEDSGYEKRFLIQSFRLEGGKLSIDASALGQGSVERDLPPVTLSNVGGPRGETPENIGKVITGAFVGSVMKVVGNEVKARAEDKGKGAAEKALEKLLH